MQTRDIKEKSPRSFSLFPEGYRNKEGKAVLATKPNGVGSLEEVYWDIKSDRARNATLQLREMTDEDAIREFKKLNFAIATFAGIFRYRSANQIANASGMLTVDIDHLASEEEARSVQQKLIADTHFETCLCFVSPSGKGVKWIVTIPDKWKEMKFKKVFEEMFRYVLFEYGLAIDRSGSDISRACFLPWDEHCYINPAYQNHIINKV